MIGKQNFLWQTLRDDKKNLFLIGLLITNMLLAGLFNSLIYTRFGECIELSMADKMGLVKDTAITILVIIFFDFIRNTLYGLTVSYTSENVFLSIKKRIFKKLTDLPVAFLEQKQDKADIINRINTDLGKLKDALTNDLTWRLRLVIVGAIAGVNCFLINWKLAIGYFFILLPSVFFLKKISVRIIAAQKERSKNIGSIISVLMDYMNGILICRSFNLEKILSSRFDEFNEKTGAASFDSEKIGLRLSTIQLVTNAAMVILLFIFGIVFIINGYLSVGGLIAFITISYSVQNALGLLDSLFSTFRNMKASSTRIQEFLDLESERRGRCFEINNNAPVIELDDFRFSFTNKEILRGLRLTVNRGEHIGIAGLSGCGKSTLLKLLAGFYETNEGCLLFGYPQHE